MGESYRDRTFFLFIGFSGMLCLTYSLIFRPVTYEAQGDFPAYLDLARQIFHLPGATDTDLSHRSPLYPLIMGFFMLLFGEAHYLVPLIGFQYFLIFVSSLLVYRIILNLTGQRLTAFIAGIAGLLNLATIFFGYMVLTETLALFLFNLTAWLLLKYVQDKGRAVAFAAGLVTGLLILARFNMLGFPVVVIAILLVVFFLGALKADALKILTDLSMFAAGAAVILNMWAFRNYIETGRYELIPRHHLGTRWAVPATINYGDEVTDEYEPVLKIFLKTRANLLENEHNRVYRKGSLMENGFIRRMNNNFRPAVSGYLMYRDSEDELLAFYGLSGDPEGIRILSEKLKPFYNQIAVLHKTELKRFRIYSLLYTFKHISPTLPGNESTNLNMLPSPFHRAYKILFMAVIIFAYAGSVLHMIWMVSKPGRIRNSLTWIIIYGAAWYFPAVNLYANVLGDANRFRYPADLILIGLAVSYICFMLRAKKAIPASAAGE